MSPLHTRITNASRRAQPPSRKTAYAHGSSRGSLRPETVCPLRHKGLLCLGGARTGSSVGHSYEAQIWTTRASRSPFLGISPKRGSRSRVAQYPGRVRMGLSLNAHGGHPPPQGSPRTPVSGSTNHDARRRGGSPETPLTLRPRVFSVLPPRLRQRAPSASKWHCVRRPPLSKSASTPVAKCGSRSRW